METEGAQGTASAPELRILDRRAFVGFPPLELQPGLTLTDFALQIPQPSFPFDFNGGAARYQRQRLRFGFLELSVDPELLRRAVGGLGAHLPELRALKLHPRDGRLEGEAKLAGSDDVAVSFKVACEAGASGPDRAPGRLAFRIYEVRLYGWSPLPVAQLGAWLARAVAQAGLLPDVRRLGATGFSASVLPELGKWAAVSRGFRLPLLEDPLLQSAQLLSDGLKLRFAADELPSAAPHEEALGVMLEGARAFAEAEEALATDALESAREIYLKVGETADGHPFAVERLLSLWVADPRSHALALDLCAELAKRRRGEPSPVALWAEAVVRERNGEGALAAERFLALGALARKRGEEVSARLAAEAATRAAAGSAPRLAVRAYRELLSLQPDHLPALRGLAEACEAAQDRGGALRAYRRLAALSRDSGEAAAAHLKMAQWSAQSDDDLAAARLQCEAALRRVPDLPPALELLAQLCFRNEENLRSLGLFDRLRDVASRTQDLEAVGRAHLGAGRVWEEGLSQLDNALLRYREAAALLLDLDRVEPLYRASAVAERLGRWQEALAGYHQLCEEVGPHPADDVRRAFVYSARVALARLYRDALSDLSGAREQWEAVLALEPGDPGALAELLPHFRASGRWAELADACERAAAHQLEAPKRAALYAEAGELCRTRLEQESRAETLLSAALEADPHNRQALEGALALAESHRDVTQICRTLRVLAELQAEPADRINALRRLALTARDRALDFELAIYALRELLRLEPNDLPALADLCALQRNRHDVNGLKEALEARADAATALGDLRLAQASLRELAQLLELRLGRPAEALAALERAARISVDSSLLTELSDLALRIDRPALAREALTGALAALPASVGEERRAELQARLGRACELLGDTERAVDHYARALQGRPLDEEVAARLEQLYRERGAREPLRALLDARARALSAAGRSARAAALWMRSATEWVETGPSEEVHRRLCLALESDPLSEAGERARRELEALRSVAVERELESWERVVDAEPSLAGAALERRLTLLRGVLAHGEVERVGRLLRRRVGGEPPAALVADLCELRAQVFSREGAIDEAAQALAALGSLEMSELRDRRRDAWLQRARLWEGHRDLLEATRSYRQALAIAPDSYEARRGLERTLRARQEWRELAQALEAEGEAYPQALLFEELGNVLLQRLGDNESALRAYERAARLDPSAVGVHRRLFELCVERGDKARATAVLEALAGTRDQTEAAALLREAAGLHGTSPETLRLLRKAHALVAASGEELRRLAELSLSLETAADALPLWRDLAREGGPTMTDPAAQARVYLRWAELAGKLGDRSEAAEALEELLQRQPTHPEALERWVGWTRTAGRPAALAEALGRQVPILLERGQISSAVEAYLERSEALEALGDRSSATASVESARELARKEGDLRAAARAELRRSRLLLADGAAQSAVAEALDRSFGLFPLSETAAEGERFAEARGDLEGTLIWLDRRIGLEPDAPWVADAWLQSARILSQRLGRPEAAEKRLRRAMEVRRPFPEAEAVWAELLEANGRWEELAALRRAQGRPREAAALFRKSGDSQRAVELLLEAMKAAPEDRALASEVAELLAHLGRYREAEALDAATLAVDPLASGPFERQLRALESRGDTPGAARLQTERADAAFVAGDVEAAARADLGAAASWRKAGAEDRALACEERAFARAPTSDEAFLALRRSRETDVRALAELLSQRAQAVPEQAPSLLREKALRLQSARETLFAAEAWDELLEIRPDDLEALLARGDCAVHAAGQSAGETYWRRALSLDGQLSPADRLKLSLRLGHSALARGDSSEAAQMLEEALRLDPDPESPQSAEALSTLLELYAERGDGENASRVALSLARRAECDDAEAELLHRRALELAPTPEARLAFLDRAVADRPLSVALAAERAALLESEGRLHDAERVLAGLPPDRDRLNRRARLLEATGRVESSLSVREEAASAPPVDAEALESVLRGYLELNLPGAAARVGSQLFDSGMLSGAASRLIAERLSSERDGAALAIRIWPLLLSQNPLEAEGWARFSQALGLAGRDREASLADGFGAALTAREGSVPPVALRALPSGRRFGTQVAPLPKWAVEIARDTLPRLSALIDQTLDKLGQRGVRSFLDPAGGCEGYWVGEDRWVLGAGALAKLGPVELSFLCALALTLGDGGKALFQPGVRGGFSSAVLDAFTACPSPLAAGRVLAQIDTAGSGRVTDSPAFKALALDALARHFPS